MQLLWPFEAPRNTTCYVDKRVLRGERDILLFVCEEEDDHDTCVYHAMTGEEGTAADDIVVVCLEELVTIDSSVCLLASLPVNWWATRVSRRSEWHTEPIPESERATESRSSEA